MQLRLSRSTRVLAIASPVVLVGLGGFGAVRGGLASPGTGLLLVGVVLGLSAAWVLPWESTLDADGVHRRSLLRRQDVPWDDVVAVERHRHRADGPLVLRTTDRERLVLTDVVETPGEWDALREFVGRAAPGAAVPEPPPGHPFHHR